jgi:DNA-binding NarL/FixJ family response regulator
MDNVRGLIVDQDRSCYRMLVSAMSVVGMHAQGLTDPQEVTRDLRQSDYAVMWVDLGGLGTDALPLLAHWRQLSPATKIILMTEQTNRSTMLQALRQGVYDFIDKPLVSEVLQHKVQHALHAWCMEREHRVNLEELRQKDSELMELNDSFTQVTRMIERIRSSTETRLVIQIRTLMAPLVHKMKEQKCFDKYEEELKAILNYIDGVNTGCAITLQAYSSLSTRELHIALMIKEGRTDSEIAEKLYVSSETVKVHRRNIRKKLGITGTKNKLASYLQALQEDSMSMA